MGFGQTVSLFRDDRQSANVSPGAAQADMGVAQCTLCNARGAISTTWMLVENVVARFLDDEELGPAIRELVKGGDLRCAVAFWGKDAARTLFPGGKPPTDARLICDIAMGGTNPYELEALGAPDNSNLLHLKGLHAKVYISDRGLIVGSANASNNGIGFLNVAGLVEAGTFHDPGSDVFDRTVAWFESLWKRSRLIDVFQLELARDNWKRRKAGASGSSGRSADPTSLLDHVVSDPASFRGVGFVFTSGTSTVAHRKEAAGAFIKEDDGRDEPLLSKRTRKALRLWPLGNIFSDWSSEDISAWPQRFVCAHEGGRGGVSYWFYERSHSILVGHDRGMVFATQAGDLRRSLGFLHGRKTMVEADAPRLRLIFEKVDHEGRRLFESGNTLASFLGDLDLSA